MKWGILGTGFIADKVANLGIKRASHTIVCVGSRLQSKADAFCLRNDIKKAYDSYEKVIHDPEVDAVYIALPSSLHYEWSMKASKAGKHILCEKPICFDSNQVAEIIEECVKNNTVFLDGTFFKHHPRNNAIINHINSGELGNINSVYSHFSWYNPCDYGNSSEIRINPLLEPTGVLGDMAWYTVRFILQSYNYELPIKASCTSVKRHERTGALEHCVGVLIFEGNRSGIFEAGFDHVMGQRSRVSGTRGVLEVEDSFLPWSGMRNEVSEAEEYNFSVGGGVWAKKVVSTGGKLEEEWMILDFESCVNGKLDWKKWANESVCIHKVLDVLWKNLNVFSN